MDFDFKEKLTIARIIRQLFVDTLIGNEAVTPTFLTENTGIGSIHTVQTFITRSFNRAKNKNSESSKANILARKIKEKYNSSLPGQFVYSLSDEFRFSIYFLTSQKLPVEILEADSLTDNFKLLKNAHPRIFLKLEPGYNSKSMSALKMLLTDDDIRQLRSTFVRKKSNRLFVKNNDGLEEVILNRPTLATSEFDIELTHIDENAGEFDPFGGELGVTHNQKPLLNIFSQKSADLSAHLTFKKAEVIEKIPFENQGAVQEIIHIIDDEELLTSFVSKKSNIFSSKKNHNPDDVLQSQAEPALTIILDPAGAEESYDPFVDEFINQYELVSTTNSQINSPIIQLPHQPSQHDIQYASQLPSNIRPMQSQHVYPNSYNYVNPQMTQQFTHYPSQVQWPYQNQFVNRNVSPMQNPAYSMQPQQSFNYNYPNMLPNYNNQPNNVSMHLLQNSPNNKRKIDAVNPNGKGEMEPIAKRQNITTDERLATNTSTLFNARSGNAPKPNQNLSDNNFFRGFE